MCRWILVAVVVLTSACMNGPSCPRTGEACDESGGCCPRNICQTGTCLAVPGEVCRSAAECFLGACEEGRCCAGLGEPCGDADASDCCCGAAVYVDRFCFSAAGGPCTDRFDCLAGLACVGGTCS